MNQDIAKLIVVLAAFLYLNVVIRPRIRGRNYWLMNAGLLLLLFAATLDFTDGIKSMDYVPILGHKAPMHDLLEDQFGDTPGFMLFAFGAFCEILKGAWKKAK